jgi:tetrapyrrole methylase family protein/MazG family protein
MRAGKVQGRARRVGFDWPEVSGALEALDSETAELKEAIAANDLAAMEEELGDLLFSAVNVSRFLSVDAEQALTCATDKFIARFDRVEQLAAERGMDMTASSLEELDALWREAKAERT